MNNDRHFYPPSPNQPCPKRWLRKAPGGISGLKQPPENACCIYNSFDFKTQWPLTEQQRIEGSYIGGQKNFFFAVTSTIAKKKFFNSSSALKYVFFWSFILAFKSMSCI